MQPLKQIEQIKKQLWVVKVFHMDMDGIRYKRMDKPKLCVYPLSHYWQVGSRIPTIVMLA